MGKIGITKLEPGRKPAAPAKKEIKWMEKRPGIYVLDYTKGVIK